MAQNKLSFYANIQRQKAIAKDIHLNDDIVDSRFGEQNEEYDIEEHEQYI